MTTSDYLGTTIRRIVVEQRIKAEADPLAEIATQEAMAGPIAEIWDTPEEEIAWAHLSSLTQEPVLSPSLSCKNTVK